MNHKKTIGTAIVVIVVISVIILSYTNISSIKSDNTVIINQPTNTTNQVQPTTGKNYTLNLSESVGIKNP